MKDRFGRQLNYLRISITDRCDLRCSYCMPPEGVPVKSHDEILTYEEIERVVRIAGSLGFSKFRITGGEPLVRRGVPGLIERLTRLPHEKDLALTTNGTRLASLAPELHRAGLRRINISLDTLDPGRFQRLTGRDALGQVLAGIDAALQTGFRPVKLNVLLLHDFNEDEAESFVERFVDRDLTLRFIESMPMDRVLSREQAVLSEEIQRRIAARWTLTPLPGEPGSASRDWQVEGAPLRIGFISPLSHAFCSACNRIRLTADGQLKPCLYSKTEVDLRRALRSGMDDDAFAAFFAEAVNLRIDGHALLADEGFIPGRFMSQIGG